jgi:class 3 adenylate cyclase/tetratricopeptide (TPR) repeat protein
MRCGRCQFGNRNGVRFCEECGAKLEQACPGCGHAVPPDRKFCGNCGQALTTSPTSAPKFGSPQTYTPKHLAEKILTSKSALEGERKQVTVLFADVKGSMELLADRDPEEARTLLDPVLEHMMEAVHRYEGTVNQVMGDGIMALFGAPVAHEDHAVRACYAALRMQEAVKRYAEGVRRTEGIPLQIRVGLNSGEVVVRAIGSDLRVDYTAVGQTTHLAARMEQMAVPGSILTTAATLGLAEGYVTVHPLGPMPVRGLEAPVEAYEIVGASTVRSRLQAAAARGLTRFVGRAAELEQLTLALERARTGHGQVVAVVGEPGVGKSRLFWEFTHSHRTGDWLILESSSVSYGKATAFLPLIDLLRAYFQIEPRDEARKVREKVTGRLLSLDRALEPSLPAFLWLLDAPGDDPHWEQLDSLQRRQRTLDGVRRLLLRESQVQPLLVLFEDLHWIDTETQALLNGLVESLPTARLLLLVNYRPEYQHPWSSKTYYRQLRIDPLPPESAEALLEALLGNDPGLRALKHLLIQRTEGNPFFLEESARTLVETKALVGERGAYRLAKVSETLQIPASATAILAARIDRLAPEDKRLLQAAAVVGKDVPFALLQAITEEPEETLRGGLAHLQAAEFLYETSLFPDLEFTFKHALTHDVAYTSLLQERRRALHARIVDAIEALYPDRLTEQVERLASHAFRGEVWEKAVGYLRQAGLRAMARAANRDAAAYLEQALEALRHLPEHRETTELAIDLRFDIRTALVPLAERDRMQEHLRIAESLASALGDQRRLGRVSIYMVIQTVLTQEYGEAMRVGRRALAISDALGDLSIAAPANAYLGVAYEARGDHLAALDHLQRNVTLIPEELRHERFGQATSMASFSRSILSLALAELGRFDEAISRAEEAARIAEEMGQHRYSLSFAWHGLGWAHASRGDLARGITVLGRCVELCRTSEFHVLMPAAAASLTVALAQAGRADEARALAEEVAGGLAPRRFHAEPSLVDLGAALLLAGRGDTAAAAAREALGASRRHGARASEAHALHLLGEIAAHADPPDPASAEGHYSQALALADDLGMRPLVAHGHLGLGKLYRRAGDGVKAEEHLQAATTMYREMGMTFWVERAEAERAAAP